MQVLSWFLQDKKQQSPIKFLPKIIISSKSTLYVQVEPKDPTTTSNIIITAFASQSSRSIIPIRVEWSRFKIKSESVHATEKIHCLAGNTYMCEPGDVGGYIKAIIRSVDESISGQAQAVIGPIGIDVMVKRVIDGALYAGNLLSQVIVCERERKNNVTVRLYNRTIEFVDDLSQQKLVKQYSISQPKIQLNPKDPTRVYFRFEQDQSNTVRDWLNKIFNIQNQSVDQSSLSIRVPYSSHSSNSSKMRLFQKSHGPCPNKFQMRFISRLSRDLFLFTQRAFVCREDMKNSIYIQRIQTLQNLSTEQDYYKFLEYMSLKMEICRISQYAKQVEEDRDAKLKDLNAMEQSIGQMTLTYLKIIQQKGKHDKIEFQHSYSQINHTREEFLNRKHVRELKSENESLKQRLRELNEQIDLLKFFKKEDNESMIFNQTSNPFAKKANDSMVFQTNSPEANKSNLKSMHQLSLNYTNLLAKNQKLESRNRILQSELMGRKGQQVLDRSQNMIELLGSLDEREQREARDAKFVQYEQKISILMRENEDMHRKIIELTQSKQKGVAITKPSKFLFQQPSFVGSHSISNHSINQSISNASNSFMNASITSQAAMLKLEQNLQSLSRINSKLQQDCNRLRKERDYYRTQFNKMKEYIKQFQSENAHLDDSRLITGQVSKYREEIQKLENQKKSLLKKLQSISRENSLGLKQEYLLRQKKIKELEQSVDKLIQQNKRLSQTAVANKNQGLELMASENSKMKKINTQLLEEIKALKVELQQRRDDNVYNSRVIELQNELNFVKSTNDPTSSDTARLLEQVNELSKQNARLRQQSEDKSAKLQNQALTIQKLMMEQSDHPCSPAPKQQSSLSSTNSKQKCYSQRCNQSTIEELQKYKREVKKLQEEIIFMKKSADAINRSRDLTMEMDGYYQQKIQILKKQMDALYLENENLSKMCERYGKDAREANKELNKCRQKIMSLMKSKHEDSSLLISD